MGMIKNAADRIDTKLLAPNLKRSWEDFERETEHCHHLFIFGAGKGAEYYLCHYKGNIEAVIDNSTSLQGVNLSELYPKDSRDKVKHRSICTPEILSKFFSEEIIVLITSLRYHGEIALQLSEIGIENVFILAVMEKQRLEAGVKVEDDLTNYYQTKYSQFDINPRKMVFFSMGGYSGHSRAIAEELGRRTNDLDVVWVVQSIETQTLRGFRTISINNIGDMIGEMYTAGFWIFDERIPPYINKRKEQVYIQVKHWSSITLKSFGLAVARFRDDTYNAKVWLHDRDMIDYIFTGSEFDEKSCRKCFEYDGKFVRVGSPRSDILKKKEGIRCQVVNKYHIAEDTKILLYAPTFRVSDIKKNITAESIMIPDMRRVLYEFESTTGSNWTILLRMHPRMRGFIPNRYEDICIDADDYPDSEELVASCDAMITDYSSIMFEPAYAGIPVFLYAPDRKEYIDHDRELLLNYDDLPFPIATSEDELAECIRELDIEQHRSKVRDYLASYGVKEDGKASQRAADFIMKLMG